MMGGKAMIRKGLWLKTIFLSACEREREVCLLTTHHLCSCLGQEQQKQSLQLEEHLKNRGREAVTNSLSVHVAHMHTRTHARTHARTRARTHTHTHTSSPSCTTREMGKMYFTRSGCQTMRIASRLRAMDVTKKR